MKKIWIIIVTIILSGALTGGGTYYYLNNKTTKEKKDLERKIDEANAKISDLKTQIDDLNSEIKSSSSSSTSSLTTKAALNTDIEKIDFSKLVTINTKLDDTLSNPVYADLNSDNSEEALVVKTNGGTGAYKDVYIYGIKNGSAFKFYEKQGLSRSRIEIVNNSVYLDYVDFNSTINQNVSSSDLVADIHTKVSWNGTEFVEENR